MLTFLKFFHFRQQRESFLTVHAQELKRMKFLFLTLAIIASLDFYPTNAKLFPIEVKWWLLVTISIYIRKCLKIPTLIYTFCYV